MSMELEISPESGFLRVVATGEFSLGEARRTFLEVLEAVAVHQAGKVLLDGRGVVGDPKIIERFYYGSFVARATTESFRRGRLSCLPRFAYVLEEPGLDPHRFGESVAVNRGMYLKAFDNLPEALGWLGILSATNNGERSK